MGHRPQPIKILSLARTLAPTRRARAGHEPRAGIGRGSGGDIGGAAPRRARRRLAPSLSLSSVGDAAAADEIKGRVAP